jgi:hypothetical protein
VAEEEKEDGECLGMFGVHYGQAVSAGGGRKRREGGGAVLHTRQDSMHTRLSRWSNDNEISRGRSINRSSERND